MIGITLSERIAWRDVRRGQCAGEGGSDALGGAHSVASASGSHLWGKLAGELAWWHAARISPADLAGHDYPGLAGYLASLADLVILPSQQGLHDDGSRLRMSLPAPQDQCTTRRLT